MKPGSIVTLLATLFSIIAHAEPPTSGNLPGDRMLADYFADETAAIAARSLSDIQSSDDWSAHKADYRRQLAEMLGLDPMPERTDLHVTLTGKLETPQFTVEKLYFQSLPHLYVTANLYIPKNLTGPVPAILYVCGHSQVKKNGIAYGAKSDYQTHGAWFARNGYVCLMIDPLQLGEIEGIHHGLYRQNMWWWMSRGYTPAGVEAWNSMRAIDYLQSRPEVDKEKIGMTGRSGGGAYSWWTAALDDRVKVAIPVAGITDMHNHIVDGTIEGHCDCMFMVNTYRWDFAQVAALVSPRPLLISNSDKDTIFPLDGVERLHFKVREIYHLQKADANLGLLITEGPHKDTQDLQVPAFRWFNRFFKNDIGPLTDSLVTRQFSPEELRVYTPGQEPADQINTKIQETFVPMAATPKVPASPEEWTKQRDTWRATLLAKSFMAWPTQPAALDLKPMGEDQGYEFTSQPHVRLALFIKGPLQPGAKRINLHILDAASWPNFDPQASGKDSDVIDAYLAVRGVGPAAWTADEKKLIQIRRRFGLLGTTMESMQAWDIRRGLAALRSIDGMKDLPITLEAGGTMAGCALYASLFEPPVAALQLHNLPTTHHDGPQFLNVLKTLDIPAAVAVAAQRSNVRLIQANTPAWNYPAAVSSALGWPRERLQISAAP
jgi:dienelactone hydrolase